MGGNPIRDINYTPHYQPPAAPVGQPVCSESDFRWYGPSRDNVAISPYWAPPLLFASPTMSSGTLISSDPTTYLDAVTSSLARGSSSHWLVINLSGLKHINDTFVGGHEAGNEYLRAWQRSILEVARFYGIEPGQVMLVRDGPNFALRVPDAEVGARIMNRLISYGSAIEINYEHNGRRISRQLTPGMLDGKTSLVNSGLITFEASQLSRGDGSIRISRDGVYRGLREAIYYLNRPESSEYLNRFGEAHRIDAAEAARLDSYRLEERLIDHRRIRAEASRVEAPAGTAHVEPRSGLRSVDQLMLDGVEILRSGRSINFAFFDGNAMGSFRTLGFLGEAMMDSVVEARIGQAAANARLAEMGIRVYRHGSGSEEFYLLAEERVTPERMEEAARRLMTELNRTPFEIRAQISELAETEMGRRYLAEHPNLPRETVNGREYVRVDITEATRGRNGQFHRGLTITLGHGMISAPAGEGDLGQLLREGMSRIMEHGEAAKHLNPTRGNMLLRVIERTGRIFGRISPLSPELTFPRPIEGRPGSPSLEVLAAGTPIEFSMENGRINSSAAGHLDGLTRFVLSSEPTSTATGQLAEQFLQSARRSIGQATGIELRGSTPEAIRAEIDWIMNSSAENVASRYGTDAAGARQLQMTTALAVSLPVIENGEVSFDRETGRITVRSGSESRVFSDPAEAQRYVLEQNRAAGGLRVRVANLLSAFRPLNVRPGSIPDMAYGAGGMALTGALAETLVALMFESYAAATSATHDFSFAPIGQGALHGFVGWGTMGIKLQFAQAIGLSPGAGMGFAILLPMMDAATDPTLSVQTRFASGISGGLGFGGFIATERGLAQVLTARGITAHWPRMVGGAMVAALVATSANAALSSDWVQGNLSYEAQSVAVDVIGFANARLESYVYGQMTGQLVNLGTRALIGVRTAGPWGLAAVATGTVGDGFMEIGYNIGDVSNYDRQTIRLLSRWMDHWDAQSPWYRIDRWGLNRLARTVNSSFLGQEIIAGLDFIGSSMDGCEMNDGTTCLQWAANRQCAAHWPLINQFYAGLLLSHARPVVQDGQVTFEFDVNAINRAVNSNTQLREMLGYIQYYRPQDFSQISRDAGGNYVLTQESARSYLAYLERENIALPMRGENGAITNQTMSAILTEVRSELQERHATFQTVRRYLQIEQELLAGRYEIGSARHRQDISAGLVNDAANLREQPADIAREITAFRTRMQVEYAESLMANNGSDPEASGDLYLGLAIIRNLIGEGRLNRNEWLRTLPTDRRIRAERGLRFADRVIELRGELEELRTEVSRIEATTADGSIPTGTEQTLVSLCRKIRELETYYTAAGYNHRSITGLISFRNSVENLLGDGQAVVALPSAGVTDTGLYAEPANETEREARELLAVQPRIPLLNFIDLNQGDQLVNPLLTAAASPLTVIHDAGADSLPRLASSSGRYDHGAYLAANHFLLGL